MGEINNPIFVIDDTIIPLFTPDNQTIKSLVTYQIGRSDDHKIYLPPSVRKIFLENRNGENKAQIDNLFNSVVSTYEKKFKIIQELSLTAEMLNIPEYNGEIVLVTENSKLSQDKIVEALKSAGFSTIINISDLDLYLKQIENN